MRKHNPFILSLALCLGLSLVTMPGVRAHDGPESDDGERGGDIAGAEDLEQHIKLAPTAAAPLGAHGSASIEASNEDGTSTGELELKVEGLPLGTYAVSVTSLADGTTVTDLGTFDVASSGGEDEEANDADDSGDDEQVTTDASGGDSGSDADDDSEDSETEVQFGGDSGVPFPAGFNPMDIGVITVSSLPTVDGTGGTVPGTVLLQGDFSAASKSLFSATVAVEPGDDPDVSGTAMVRARVKPHGQIQTHFALKAANLPPKTQVEVTFNGTETLKARTSAKGTLNFRKIPKTLRATQLTTVEVKDLNGSSLATVHF